MGLTIEDHYKRFERCSICEFFYTPEWDHIKECPVRRGEKSALILPAGVDVDKKGNLTIT
jgi:hypothetical protein